MELEDLVTGQEVFDFVVENLRKQGCKSETNSGCAYRGDNGLKCAAGFLITDEEYHPDMEDMGIDDASSVIVLPPIVENHIHLVGALQVVHDSCDVDKWEGGFKSCAAEFGLVYTPPKDI